MGDIRLNDPVLVNKKYRATVKFVGVTEFKPGIWYGVELEKPKGKHNGTVSAC
jgi:CAP-Gly domain-containing linker protein 3/4